MANATLETKNGTHDGGVIACASYAQGRRVADLPIADVSETLAETDQFVWIGLYEPREDVLRQVQSEFGLHDLAVEDALRAHQRPKLEQYEGSLFVVLRTAQLDADHRLELGETHVFVGERFVISVRHGSLKSHIGVRAKCEAAPELLKKGPGFVLYALMDFIVDQYFPIIEAFEEQVETLEGEMFGERVSRDTANRIYTLKRDLLTLKRAVSPVVEVCNRLTRYDITLVHEETRPYFRDVYDHALRVNEMIDSLRELLTAALEAHLSLISVQQNDDVKRLAAWAAIIAVPTMIAGIYGMNFRQMPELSWAYGYPAAWAVMIVACVGLFAGFRRSGWL
ncbi:MAG: magnesium and cobalt transport protein CorA [Acidobacteria bacterium RIFCSPLOWO2_02_FULL_65_29]|nr:MAG: magnesium and cobalt transport protein CorA [Acidobacteria bacterium RIFCSPLOWO2_02_FULL_65_29]